MPSLGKVMLHDQMHWLKTLIFTHLQLIKAVASDQHNYANNIKMITGLPLGGRTPYITSKNRLRTPKLHIRDVPRTSENSLVRPKMDIETSCLQKKPAHIYQIT